MTALVALGLWLAAVPTEAGGAAPGGRPEGASVPAESPQTPAKAGGPKSTTEATAAKPAATGKLAPAVAKEMADAIIAVNKALGLESWPAHGVKPCIDRGGQGILSKDVTPDDTKKCAEAAVYKGFPALSKSYVLAILMGGIGPVTVLAVGGGDATGWAAYSCDPTRACKPMRLDAKNKWGKRLAERHAKACGDSTTIWLPAGQRVCP